MSDPPSGRPPRPARVAVRAPATVLRARTPVAAAREIDEQTTLGDVFVRSLVRAQLRLALFVCAGLAVLLGGLPLLLALVPALTTTRLAGVPLPWLLLGGAAYPVLVLGGWLYVRQAERNERDFTELVERP